ncbi:hypothetical protein J2755_001642 [Methanohalophilus levihalophilus]|uniref:hypothetical protein n=1 Tax=Methanohalophilus levihalophilus TaxID=1431282 RepID=UPI001AE0ED39|nr:hypothetical protein [Methanohalophilus levihalophilus]MBP2030694.1 hypothetical protein [Methanohalophilus levihalophilus]
MKKIVLLIMLALLFSGCTGDEAAEDGENIVNDDSLGLGFTDFPYAGTSEGYQDTFLTIINDGNMVAMHFDDGIPWEQALSGEYSEDYIGLMQAKSDAIPKSHRVYLAITPINFERDDLATNLDGNGVWRSTLDDEDVIRAYTNHALTMIDIFEPDYFAYAIEPNLFYFREPARWDEFSTLSESVYAEIKAEHPDLPVFFTIQAETYHADKAGQTEALKAVLPNSDIIAISTYPFAGSYTAFGIPGNYFADIKALDNSKPYAISETSWPAEDIADPYPVLIAGSEEDQYIYLDRIFDEFGEGEFIVWFFSRDFDEFWDDELKDSPMAPTIRLWKDSGLYDGNGNARDALELWKQKLG